MDQADEYDVQGTPTYSELYILNPSPYIQDSWIPGPRDPEEVTYRYPDPEDTYYYEYNDLSSAHEQLRLTQQPQFPPSDSNSYPLYDPQLFPSEAPPSLPHEPTPSPASHPPKHPRRSGRRRKFTAKLRAQSTQTPSGITKGSGSKKRKCPHCGKECGSGPGVGEHFWAKHGDLTGRKRTTVVFGTILTGAQDEGCADNFSGAEVTESGGSELLEDELSGEDDTGSPVVEGQMDPVVVSSFRDMSLHENTRELERADDTEDSADEVQPLNTKFSDLSLEPHSDV